MNLLHTHTNSFANILIFKYYSKNKYLLLFKTYKNYIRTTPLMSGICFKL